MDPTKGLEIFPGSKVMLKSNFDVAKGLHNSVKGYIKEITSFQIRREQAYSQDIQSIRIEFGKNNIFEIYSKSIQFLVCYGTVERRMLLIILS